MARSTKSGEVTRIIGACLRAERESTGMKQAALAMRLGMTTAGLSNIESGHSRLRLETLLQICALLGTDPVRLTAHIVRLTANVPRETSALPHTTIKE